MATARLRADAGRRRDPLAAAHAIVQRAAAGDRPLSLFERSTVRQHIREYEAQAGCTLADEHRVLLTHAEQLLGNPARCTALLDRADVLYAIDEALIG